MTIKLLNKHLTSFLSEPFPENLINAFKYNKRLKRLGKKSTGSVNTLNEGVANVASKNVGLSSTIKNANTQADLDSSNPQEKLSNFLNLQSFKHVKVPSDYLYGPNNFRSGDLGYESVKTGGTGEMSYFIKGFVKSETLTAEGESLSIDMKKAENQIIEQFFENKLSTSVLGTKNPESKTQLPLREAQASTPFLHQKTNTSHLSRNLDSRSNRKKVQVGINSQNGSNLDKLNRIAAQDLHEVVSDPTTEVVGRKRPEPKLADSFSSIGPHFLFSLDQIRSEKVEQARLYSSKGIQNKNDSEFKKQLRECKKIRLLYGNLSKRDLKKSLAKVQRLQGLSNENLLLYLESRLDVILQRCGFFPTIRAARQSILHGRILVNFKVIKVPSYQLKAGNIIKVNLNKSNCVKIRSYPKIQTHTTFPNPNKLSGVIQSDTPRLNHDPQNFILDYLDLNSVPTKFKKDIINFLRSFKKSQPLSFFIRFIQTHIYFQSIFSLLSFFKNKNNSELKINVEEGGNTDKSISSVVPFMSNWRFSIPPYALSSILEIQSILYDKSVQTKSIQNESIQSAKAPQRKLSDFTNQSECFSIPTSDSSTLIYNSKTTEPIETGVSEVTALKKMRSYQDPVFPNRDYRYGVRRSDDYRCGMLGRIGHSGSWQNPNRDFQETIDLQSQVMHPFINVFHYCLEIKKKLLYSRSYFWGETYSIKSNSILSSESGVNKINPLSGLESSINEPPIQTSLSKNKKEKTSILYPSIQTNYLEKESKPLHLEVSYSSLCAIFLFPPQQIYFPATIDIDLITKLTGIRNK